MVQRPRPDLRGGCAAMRIPTVTSGTLAIQQRRNREVTTNLPLAEVLTARAPGVYAVVARDPNEQPRKPGGDTRRSGWW